MTTGADREVDARLDEERVITGDGLDGECPCMTVDGELCDVCRLEDSERLHGHRD